MNAIQTPRLLLREFVAADLPALHALLSCPRVMEFSPAGPLSLAQAKERLDGFLAAYKAHGFGKWGGGRAKLRGDHRLLRR